MTRSPERIWTGDWRAQSEQARRAAAAARTGEPQATGVPDSAPAAAPAGPSRRSRRDRARRVRPILVGCAAILLVGAGALGGVLAFGGEVA